MSAPDATRRRIAPWSPTRAALCSGGSPGFGGRYSVLGGLDWVMWNHRRAETIGARRPAGQYQPSSICGEKWLGRGSPRFVAVASPRAVPG